MRVNVHFSLSLSRARQPPWVCEIVAKTVSNVCCFIVIFFHFNLSHSAHNILGGRIGRQKLLLCASHPDWNVCAQNIFHCLQIFVEINKRANAGSGHVCTRKRKCLRAIQREHRAPANAIINNLSWIWWRWRWYDGSSKRHRTTATVYRCGMSFFAL